MRHLPRNAHSRDIDLPFRAVGVIWTFWADGFATAPRLVQTCLTSWRVQNPAWEVRALDRTDVGAWLDLPDVVDLSRRDLTVQKVADIVRLALLRRYGGVWTDATVFCLRPLDDWLPHAWGPRVLRVPQPRPRPDDEQLVPGCRA